MLRAAEEVEEGRALTKGDGVPAEEVEGRRSKGRRKGRSDSGPELPAPLLHSPGKDQAAAATCRSPATGLLCLSAVSTGANINLAPRLGLVRTFGQGLVINNTAGGGDRLELWLELQEETLADALERAGTELPGLTVRPVLTATRGRSSLSEDK